MYMCEASNEAGKRMAVAFVTVDQPPEFIDDTRNPKTISRVGDNALLHCLVKADPKPKITWTKDGKVYLSNTFRIQYFNFLLRKYF